MEEEIVITVSNPEQRKEIAGVNKFHVYTLKGHDAKGDIEISRRYSDFNLLREILIKRWPGCYVPSLPEKKTIGSNQHLFVQSRRRGLESFLVAISLLPAIWDSQQVQIFLRNSSGDSEKLLTPLLKQSPQHLYHRYKEVFGSEFSEINPQAFIKITEFSSFIKDSKIFLDKLAETTDKMTDLYKSSLDKKLAIIEFLLPDYEKNCLLQNDEKRKAESLLFTVEDFQIKEATMDFKKANQYPPVLIVSEEIRRERRELEAFEELIKARHQYESLRMKSLGKVKDVQVKQSKINAGKESLFSKITKQTKEQQMASAHQSLSKVKEQQELYSGLTTIITNLLGLREINRFKQIRQRAYFKMLKDFSQCQKQVALTEHQIWARASQHDRIWQQGFEESLGLKSKTDKQSKSPKSPSKQFQREDIIANLKQQTVEIQSQQIDSNP